MCERSVKHMADATTRGRLERLVRREGSRQERNLGTVAEIEVGKPGRAPENLSPDVSEATASVVGKLTLPITVSEVGQRNACDV
jgi:hypothetical protein